jgi:hypothetical protein
LHALSDFIFSWHQKHFLQDCNTRTAANFTTILLLQNQTLLSEGLRKNYKFPIIPVFDNQNYMECLGKKEMVEWLIKSIDDGQKIQATQKIDYISNEDPGLKIIEECLTKEREMTYSMQKNQTTQNDPPLPKEISTELILLLLLSFIMICSIIIRYYRTKHP